MLFGMILNKRVNYLIFSDLPFDLFIKTRLKTAIKVFRFVKYFSVFPLPLLTPANIANLCRISLRVLRVNYFYVWGCADKMEIRQRLNVVVDF